MITSRAWSGKRYAVLGLARSGAAAARALLASGASVAAWDERAEARAAILPGTGRGTSEAGGGAFGELARTQGVPLHHSPEEANGPQCRVGSSPGRSDPTLPTGEDLVLADPLTLDLTGFDGVVVSPGVPLNRHPIAAHAAKFGVPVIGDIELFAQARAGLPAHKVVGITGTNGKSTTTALVHHILCGAEVPTTMGGNIGLPILGQEPLPEGGVYVLELSSFQIDLTLSLDCDVAVLLNVTPDHLDRYDDFKAYLDAKIALLDMQSWDHHAVVASKEQAVEDTVMKMTTGAELTRWFHGSYETDFADEQCNWPSLQGPHNAQNAWAARMTCLSLGLTLEQIAVGLETYPGLPHRMERVAEKDGVLFVNDSKATNPTSTAPALAAYPAVHWILGGRAKSDELDACAPHFGRVRAAYTIGEAGPMFAHLLAPHMAVNECGELPVAVERASQAARPGETVLLSPACASFDQFADYEARGDAFRSLVEAL